MGGGGGGFGYLGSQLFGNMHTTHKYSVSSGVLLKYRQNTDRLHVEIQKNDGENRQNTEKTVVYYAEMQRKRGHKAIWGYCMHKSRVESDLFLDYISPQVQFQPVFAAHK